MDKKKIEEKMDIIKTYEYKRNTDQKQEDKRDILGKHKKAETTEKKAILEKYKKIEDRLLISKFFDKIDIATKSNRIETTDFLNEMEQNILIKVIRLIKFENYKIYGGPDNSNRKIIIVYPEKMKELFLNNTFKFETLLSVFRIKVPKDDIANFNHSVYLGGIIKLGIKREKIGDILVHDEGSDIIVKKETEKFLYANLKTLTRFRDAQISIIKLNEVTNVDTKFEDIKIITSSLRLDNIVAELAKTSRSKAEEILEQERVFVNYEGESKSTKQIKQKDIVTIRGKGKFIIDEIIGNTRKGNYIIMVKKYV